jgi:hypothetical protein
MIFVCDSSTLCQVILGDQSWIHRRHNSTYLAYNTCAHCCRTIELELRAAYPAPIDHTVT